MAVLVTLLALAAPASPAWAAYQAAGGWGTLGSGPGQFNQPKGLAVDGSGVVYVADSLNNRVQRFSPDGTLLGQFGSAGSADGQFQSPFDVAIGPTGDVFVVDRNNHRVERFTPDGTFVSKFGTVGGGPGQLSHPNGLAVDNAGDVYVADYDNNRIAKFDSTGAPLTQWGSLGTGPGQMRLPADVAAPSAGAVYVVDDTNRVQMFDPVGRFVLQWGSQGTGDGQFEGTAGVATALDGSVFVADFNNRRIQRFNSQGVFVEKFGDQTVFQRPNAVAVAPNGDLYVSDGTNRVLHFRPVAGAALPPPVVGKTVNLRVVKGTVRVKLRGSKKFVRLVGAQQVPVGSTVDTKRGTVELASAADAAGGVQTGQFYSGLFVVKQKRAAKPVTDLNLTGTSFARCPRAGKASAGAAKGGPKRRLWGVATGRFRTNGRFASAGVRGTTWLTEDRCTGTLVRVTAGSITVRDKTRRRTVVVNAPGTYLAPARR